MISDILAEAVQDIRRQLEDPHFGAAYTEPRQRARIAACLDNMDTLRKELEGPPRRAAATVSTAPGQQPQAGS